MSFMQMFIYDKGRTYSADCAKCGMAHTIHEWITDDFNGERDAMREGALQCRECGGRMNPDTFMDTGRQYAGRYSAPGYMDCTDWSFDRNKRRLARELRDMYGED